jgi:hypothetical protein
LTLNPDYFGQRKLVKSGLNIEHIYFVLVARDHFLWRKPQDGISAVDFEPFKVMLETSDNLSTGIKNLLQYDWLPKEGRDFEVRKDRATLSGVTVTFEAFYAPDSRNMPIRNPIQFNP